VSLELPQIPNENLSSLRASLVDSNAELRGQNRLVRRRAFAVSIAVQSAIVAELVLIPLFAKTERVALANLMPRPIKKSRSIRTSP